MRHAGYWRWVGAYAIDVVPIVLLVGAAFYLVLGFGETWEACRAEPGSLEVRSRCLAERNAVRDSAFVVWLIYSALMEASTLQGTLGRRPSACESSDQMADV